MKLKKIVLTILTALLVNAGINVYAADDLYRFMHNDHDALVIGEITGIIGNKTFIRVEKNIVSKDYINPSAKKIQLKMKEAGIVPLSMYKLFDKNDNIKPEKGDYVLASLNRTWDGFRIAWGAYKIDTLDYEVLSVILPDSASISSKMEGAAIKVFINSDGKINKFSFDGEKGIVRAEEKNIIIFDEGKIEENEINRALERNKTIDIIGEADGPTSIFISNYTTKKLVLLLIMGSILTGIICYALGSYRNRKH